MDVESLIRQLKHADPVIVSSAADALLTMGHAVVPALVEALMDLDAQVRRKAAWALGDIGPRAAAAVPGLKELIYDPDANVRVAAAWALDRIWRT